MNENVDYFKDQKDQVLNSIEKAVLQAEIIKSVLPSKAIDNLLNELGIIKALYPTYFQQFILSQMTEEGKLEAGELFLNFGEKGYFHISVEYTKKEPPEHSKKKWYQF